MAPDYEKLFSAFINEAADAAGDIALKYFRKDLRIEDKQDSSPVTQADKQIETLLRDRIAKTFPNHGIVGEEFGNERIDAEFVWVLDPIDGTRAFMTGKPLFGTIIGLMHDGKPILGCVDQPYTKERWFGVDGTTATHNGKPIRVAPPCKLDASRLYITLPNNLRGENLENLFDLCRAAKWPQFNCDCYAYGLLAMGCCDLVVEDRLKIHDVAGIVPILTGAGGFAADWNMNPIGFDFTGEMVAASTHDLAAEAVNVLKELV